MKKRRRARELALQGLYAMEVSSNPQVKVLNELSDNQKEPPEAVQFATQLIKRVKANQEELDADIISAAKNWDFNRIAIIDRHILRIALCEFLFFDEIPPKVTINEAIDLAKSFSTAKSGKFVNGILDFLLNRYKKENRLNKQGRGLMDA